MTGASVPPHGATGRTTLRGLAGYFALGVVFGIILIKAQVVSWFRIQEMFRFQSFFMYGVIGSAVLVAAVSLWIIRVLDLRTASGAPIVVPPKVLGSGTRYWLGGAIFGVGWAFTGACPGPLFALVGSGVGVMGVALLAAIAGTWTYGALRPRLPH